MLRPGTQQQARETNRGYIHTEIRKLHGCDVGWIERLPQRAHDKPHRHILITVLTLIAIAIVVQGELQQSVVVVFFIC